MTRPALHPVAFLALFTFGSTQTFAAPSEIPRPSVDSIAVFGDSVSAGFLGDTTLGDGMNPALGIPLVGLMGAYRVGTSYLATGRSFPTTLFEPFKVLLGRSGVTAFAGKSSWSFPSRIETWQGSRPDVENFATLTETLGSLEGTLERARQIYAKSPQKKSADFVVFATGIVDVCIQRPTEDKFRLDFRNRLVQTVDVHPEARILVIPIPDLVSVFTFPDEPAIHAPLRTLSCHEYRRTAGLCTWMPNEGSTAEEVGAARAEINSRNRIMKEVVESVASLPETRARIAWAGDTIEDTPLNPDDLAADCFHPNESTQKWIADETWEAAENLLTPIQPSRFPATN